jgi:predicted HTH transcriptional regulator
MSHAETPDLDTIDGESAAVDFKASFDPKSKQDWCELIKDIVAMANSGGGCIVVGVADDGAISESDVNPLLAVDPADMTNRIHSYTDLHFSAFEIIKGIRSGQAVAVINIHAARIPIVFTAHGGYAAVGGQKAAFVKGSVYFRHGAKSEPGTTDDLKAVNRTRVGARKGFLARWNRQGHGCASRFDCADRSARLHPTRFARCDTGEVND